MEIKFKEWNCYLKLDKYSNNRTAIVLLEQETNDVIAVATTNIPTESLKKDEVFIKDYSENEGISDVLIDAGVISKSLGMIHSGFTIIEKHKLLIKTDE